MKEFLKWLFILGGCYVGWLWISSLSPVAAAFIVGAIFGGLEGANLGVFYSRFSKHEEYIRKQLR
jgi:hypothetical protein